MEGFIGHPLICRACLRIVENKTQSFGFIEDANGNLKDMMMCCVPEMDIYVSSNPIMCLPCIQLLVTVYNFKTRCLNTETIIRSYVQRNNLSEFNHVNLSCVVQELISFDNYFRDAHCRRMDGMQGMENCARDPNGAPRNPYGMPQGMAGSHFILSENQGNEPIRMDYEKGPPNCEMRHFTSEEDCVSRNNNTEGGNRASNGLPIMAEQEMLRSPDLARGEVVPNRNNEETQGILNEIVPPENINVDTCRQKTEDVVEENVNSEATENHSRSSKNEDENAGTCLDINEEEAQSEESSTQKFEESTEEIVTSEESINKNVPSKDEPQKEKRPRLIIRICKNKITIPSGRNEDSNEKENEQMDVDNHQTEIPPSETTALEPYQLPDNNELYQCPYCTFVTTHPDYYLSHKDNCNADLSEKKCPHCPHVTNRQQALNKHINTMHTKFVWYTCDCCPYRSTDPSCLRRHKRNMHPESLGSDHACQLCSYRCATEYHLHKHMLKHGGNPALQCQFCSYSTRDRSNFRKHIFIHNPTAQGCEFCDYKCVSPYQMKLHLKKAHHGVGMEDVDCRSEVSISKVVQDISAAILEAKSFAGHQTE